MTIYNPNVDLVNILKCVYKFGLKWPNFFLMNAFFALKGSKLFIFINKSIRSLDIEQN